MKKLIFKHSNPETKTIKDSSGADLDISIGLKVTLGMAIGKAQVNMENFRKWFKIADKIDAAKDEVELEDAEFELTKKLFTEGVDIAFPTIESKGLASEVDRIIREAKDIK